MADIDENKNTTSPPNTQNFASRILERRLTRHQRKKNEKRHAVEERDHDIESSLSPHHQTSRGPTPPVRENEEHHKALDMEHDNESFEDIQESQQQSLYSIPGAFRVTRKFVNNRHIEEITLGDFSIESSSTAKTPPIIISGALLVQEDSFPDEQKEEKTTPLSLPKHNFLVVPKRHIVVCATLSFIAFGGMFTGLLFALWDRSSKTTPTNLQNDVAPYSIPTSSPSPVIDYNYTFKPTQTGTRHIEEFDTSSPPPLPSTDLSATVSPTGNPPGISVKSPIGATDGSVVTTDTPSESPTELGTLAGTTTPSSAPSAVEVYSSTKSPQDEIFTPVTISSIDRANPP